MRNCGTCICRTEGYCDTLTGLCTDKEALDKATATMMQQLADEYIKDVNLGGE